MTLIAAVDVIGSDATRGRCGEGHTVPGQKSSGETTLKAREPPEQKDLRGLPPVPCGVWSVTCSRGSGDSDAGVGTYVIFANAAVGALGKRSYVRE